MLSIIKQQRRRVRTGVIAALLYFLLPVMSRAQCVAPGSSVNFTNTGQNATAGYTTVYVLTDSAGGIINANLSNPFSAPAGGGNYLIYAVNYSGAINNLAAGNNMNTVTGSCIAISSAPAAFCVSSVCVQAGSSISFTNNGNQTAAGYVTKYVLVDNSTNQIIQEVTSPFAAPVNPGGSYKVYTVNYDGSRTAPTLTAGTDIHSIGGTCVALSAVPLNFDVCVMIVPVTLLNFNAVKQEGHALLSWGTASEENSRNFTIERSGDGIRFTTIGTVAAAGNSSVQRNYGFTDHAPLNGNDYYRLRMTDLDNTARLSNVTLLNFNKGNSISIYPNPATDLVTISGAGEKNTISLYDATGKLLLEQRSTGSGRDKLDINKFAKGIYIIRIAANTGTVTNNRITKQ
jgi:plastocyanin